MTVNFYMSNAKTDEIARELELAAKHLRMHGADAKFGTGRVDFQSWDMNCDVSPQKITRAVSKAMEPQKDPIR